MSIKNHNSSSYCLNSNGYTLIEMAITLMVIGVLVAGFLGIYTQYEVEEKTSKTITRVNNALESIQKYRNVYGAFPCPAPMNKSRTAAATVDPADNEYGIASNYGRFLATGAVPLAAGDCAEGICIEQNTRADLGGATLRVRVGAIPFRDMQLDESDTYDAYGSRLWYAVTENMCNLTTFDETRGAINIINDQGESQTIPENSGAYVVISPGENKIGGYGLTGIMSSPCATSIDSENCRDVSVATSADINAAYLTQFVQNATLATNYDDVIEFFSSAKTQLWRRTAPGAEDILDLANNNIGIGEPAPSSTIDINQSAVVRATAGADTIGDVKPANDTTSTNREHGALRVGPTTSRLQADVYCNEAGGKCFRPENIMNTPGLTCPVGTYPTAITENVATKDATFTCAPISINCPVGQTFTGFTNTAGVLSPTCSAASAFASCPATTKTLCALNDVSLPLASHDLGWTQYRTAGSCRAQYYRCNNGNWEEPPVSWGWPNGACVDTPVVTNNVSCGGANSCWTGTYTTTSTSCSGSSDTRATDCLCDTCTKDETATCTAPLTGTGETRRYNYICPGPTPQTAAIKDPALPLGTLITASTCSCSLSPYNNFYNCDPGYIRDSGAPALAPNNWPGDINKGKYELINVSGTCTHVGSGSVVNHCTCNLADKYTTSTPTPPDTCQEAKSGSRVVGGTSYAWKFEVSKSTINAVSCTPDAPVVESAAQFQAINTYWREIAGSYTSTVDAKPAGIPEVGLTCDCMTYKPPGSTTGTCIKPSAALGKWDSYKCTCDR